MTHTERKLLTQTALIGAALTMLVLILELFGQLEAMEQWLYHRRARHFQYFTPPPTDRLVHLDIDDAALETVGAWPWPRKYLAQVMDEITAAGAKAVAWDVIFLEPQVPRYDILADGTPELIEDDKLFAESVKRAGNVLIPFSLGIELREPPTRTFLAAKHILLNDLQLSDAEVAARLSPFGISSREFTQDDYLAARRQAAFERVDQALRDQPLTFDELQAQVLPTIDVGVATSIRRLLKQQYERVRAMHAVDRFTQPAVPRGTPLPSGYEVSPPLAPLAEAAAASAYVDHVRFSDGVVRSVPLWATYRGRMYPQIGMTLACLTLDVDPRDVQVGDDYVLIPRQGAPAIVVPTHRYRARDGETYGGFMALPWFGPERWQPMYDYPAHQQPAQHVPITAVNTVIDTQDRIEANCAIIDVSILGILEHVFYFDQSKVQVFLDQKFALDDYEARRPFIEAALQESAFSYEALKAIPAAEFDQYLKDASDNERQTTLRFIQCVERLPAIVREMPRLLEQLDRERATLRQKLQGKSVLIGWIATGAIADFVPTSLHPISPGVVVHGVVFNGIMTGDLWRPGPVSLGPLMTVMLGLLTTAAATFLSPIRSALATVAIAAGWVLLNGLLLFDYANVLVTMGAPLLSITLVWTGCTIVRFIIERAERARITRRFSSYVDPALVNYVIEHPEQTNLAGQERELTVVFTDLAGFTTISETLKERTVPLLNEYMGLMVPVIRAASDPNRRGYVNKFLGDGIMFFFGAPYENAFHAADAVSTVLKMQAVMPPFNEQLRQRGLPEVQMRAGVATGLMVVGDAGPPDASDYTVIGDIVNTAARLESANKATGTLIMLHEQTVRMLDGLFLVRPLANLQVKGKTEGVMTYEPLAFMEEATDAQRRLAELTTAMVEAYREARFADCLAAADRLDLAASGGGPTKLTALYRENCRHWMEQPGDGAGVRGFRGQIVLTEK